MDDIRSVVPDAALPMLDEALRISATGTGDHENAGQSWAMADVLGSAGVPNRVDNPASRKSAKDRLKGR